MPLYFLVHDAERFHRLIAPALAESARRRSFAPCRDLAAELATAVSEYSRRYHLGDDEPLLMQIEHGQPYDRRLWTHLAGEILLFAAADVPELQTAPASLGRLIGDDLARRAYRGSHDLAFGGRPYRPDHAGFNDAADVARLADALAAADPAAWSADALSGLPGLDADDDRADELEFVREWFPTLHDLYARAKAAGQVIVCEEL
jgi:hypothetical protein